MTKNYAQRCQGGGKSDPKGVQREPKVAQRGTKGAQKGTKASPKEPQRSHVWPQGALKIKNMKKGRFAGTHFGSKNGPKSFKK